METLKALLQRLRLAAGLTLTEAAKASGFSRTHIRHNEEGRRQPSAQYLLRLSAVYQAPDLVQYCTSLGPGKGRRTYGALGDDLREAFPVVRPSVPLPRLEVAYKAALAYKTGHQLLHQLVSRPRQHPNRWKGMKLLAHELNGLEQLSVLNLLAFGAEIQAVSPHRLGFASPVVMHRDRPFLALVVKHEEAVAALFPQLGIETRRGLVRYADHLAGIAADDRRCFVNVELDGPDHDRVRDLRRAAELAIPTLRYGVKDVDCIGFSARLLADLRSIHENAPRGKPA